MGTTIEITQRDPKIINELIQIWENSVRATHHFLSEADIQSIKPSVVIGLQKITRLFTYIEDSEKPLGFIGIENDKIEMLFVQENMRGRGIGKALTRYAIEQLSVCKVDVNEQNLGALAFYRKLGFQVIDRSSQDSEGRPFPILYLHFSN